MEGGEPNITMYNPATDSSRAARLSEINRRHRLFRYDPSKRGYVLTKKGLAGPDMSQYRDRVWRKLSDLANDINIYICKS
jgi:hypothetical protein